MVIQKGIPGKGAMKGVNYGLVLWLTGALVGMFTMPFYMTINTVVVIYWVVQALVSNVIRGAIVAIPAFLQGNNGLAFSSSN